MESKVYLKIFNVLGQEVKTLVDEIQDAGYKTVEWNSRQTAGGLATNNLGKYVASGVYLYRLETTSIAKPSTLFVGVKKLLLVK